MLNTGNKGAAEADMQNEWILVGLGNPGAKYEGTRHNIGKDIVSKVSFQPGVRILTPETYMNLSGGPVAKALGATKQERALHAPRLIVVHDDLDVPFGEVKVSTSRSAGGHNGVADIIKAIGSKDFVRVRIGVLPVFLGQPRRPKGGAVEAFVLKKFGFLERTSLSEVEEKARGAIDEIVKNGAQSAMNKFN
jgi:PTH1 family peptidyl-tRNA hydrolase